MVLLSATSAIAAHGDSTHLGRLTLIDSLIPIGEYERAEELIEAALLKDDLGHSLLVKYQIRRLMVMRRIDQWDLLLFLSRDLMDGKLLAPEALQQVRLLRAVALEDLNRYDEAGAELDSPERLFGPNPTNRNNGSTSTERPPSSACKTRTVWPCDRCNARSRSTNKIDIPRNLPPL